MTQGIACGAESAKNAQPGIEAAMADRSPHHSRAASGTPTRGIRNCNPLNIRKGRSKWRGVEIDIYMPINGKAVKYDPEFCQFTGMEWGFRAAFVLVGNYITKYGCNSIEKIISRWAPPSLAPVSSTESPGGGIKASDGAALSPYATRASGVPVANGGPVRGNNTDKYIKDVCRTTGIGGRAPLAASDPRLKDIVWAMAQIESGKGILAYREAMERGWELAADTPKPPQRGGCREKGEKAGYYPAQ